MDVQMPEMDGLTATRRVREEFPPERQPRIVAMTANAMQGDAELCLGAGMDAYLSKPVKMDEVKAVLDGYELAPNAAGFLVPGYWFVVLGSWLLGVRRWMLVADN